MTAKLQAKLVPIFRYTRPEVEAHLIDHHAYLPTPVSLAVIDLVITRPWKGISLGGAVGISLQSHLRHNFTSYDRRVRVGELAYDVVKKECNAESERLLARWKMKWGKKNPSM